MSAGLWGLDREIRGGRKRSVASTGDGSRGEERRFCRAGNELGELDLGAQRERRRIASSLPGFLLPLI